MTRFDHSSDFQRNPNSQPSIAAIVPPHPAPAPPPFSPFSPRIRGLIGEGESGMLERDVRIDVDSLRWTSRRKESPAGPGGAPPLIIAPSRPRLWGQILNWGVCYLKVCRDGEAIPAGDSRAENGPKMLHQAPQAPFLSFFWDFLQST